MRRSTPDNYQNYQNHQDLIRQLITLLAVVGSFLVNIALNIFPPYGLSLDAVYEKFYQGVLIIPANYAFGVWGVIYLGLFTLAIYQFLPYKRKDEDLRKVGYLLVIACIFQSIWLYLFLSRFFTLSVVAMFATLVPLMVIYSTLRIGRKRISGRKKLCLHIPVSIYLSWTSVATMVNVACVLYFYGWNGWGLNHQVWAVIMLVVAATIATLIIITCDDIIYVYVTFWTLIAIAVRHSNIDLVRNLGIFLPIICLVVALIKRSRD
ncbi:tryptophan-rich sensory protein [Dolichospermum circinale CS-1225]|uniref:Tryptophan-rich sensory protein n=1 Tax=Dolichospermum circinale CS-537/01 TaxID=3021739 RepID=A0ABT5A616_9CYAN|nr:tryptophan-rich sensory protein [Dolichospermum circinale]MDB9459263.1 tryptophan-rich sensory protein [Dolichospermum circinale CS-545/17]MDB9486898.1 tryptophan-rich sensory protein [Dolichospermum circinale CS-537/01]MDB9523965.1 tryptophan-rich sensory protein [Dolichospermum circinale CS-1225]